LYRLSGSCEIKETASHTNIIIKLTEQSYNESTSFRDSLIQISAYDEISHLYKNNSVTLRVLPSDFKGFFTIDSKQCSSKHPRSTWIPIEIWLSYRTFNMSIL